MSAPTLTSRGVRRGPTLLVAAIAIGVLFALQVRVNGALGARLSNGFEAALLSSMGGVAVLIVLAVALPSARRGVASIPAAVRARAFPRWTMLAGVLGGYLVLSQGVVPGVTGVALYTISYVAGQILGGIAVDLWGVGPAGRQRVTRTRAIGAATVTGAVVWAVSPGLASAGLTQVSLLLLLPLTAGMFHGLQTMMNGLQTAHYTTFVPATLVNFGLGAVVAGVLVLCHLVVGGTWERPPTQPWYYLGGLLGVFVIGGAAYLARQLGLLLTSMGMISGQLVGAFVLDIVWPVSQSDGFPLCELLGTALALVGVGIAFRPSAARPVCT